MSLHASDQKKMNAQVMDDLLLKIGQNDESAFRKLYEQMSSAVFAYALSVVKNRADAEDIMQDTFLKIRAAAHLYEADGKAKSWIFTIVRNLCMMHFRENRRQIDTPADEMTYMEDLSFIEDHETRLTVRSVLKELNDEESQIIILHAVSGMKHREIASILNIPLATVLSKYHRGLKKLRKNLEGVIK
ncbi:MAG: RNA polymerase sigma factor [Erysipelotrichaceae bacterium]|nr:RNA polymerase sigma factor [Erysipelotrichaceae bacterium]